MKHTLPTLRLSLVAVLMLSLPAFAHPGKASDGVQNLPLQAKHLHHEGKTRRYYLYTPTKYQQDQPMPLVLVFHGYLGSGKEMMHTTRFNALAEQEGFMVAYPDALHRWQARSGPSDEMEEDVDFVQALLKQIGQERNVDAKRIYATGFSNGGFFTHRLACEMSDQIAAFATVGSTIGVPLTKSCEPGRAIPIMMINGVDDPVVLWRGEFKKVRYAFRDSEITSVNGMADFWRAKNQCAEHPGSTLVVHASKGSKGAQIQKFAECSPNGDVEQIIIQQGGHTWPGGKPRRWIARFIVGKTSKDVPASETMWDFFKSHPLPDVKEVQKSRPVQPANNEASSAQ